MLSLIAYEIGMFAWMIDRAPRLAGHVARRCWIWLDDEIAMVCGFATTYPVNWASDPGLG